MASSPLSSQDNNGDSSSNSQFDPNSFNSRFSPSMAIILVVLLSAFFFLAFFSIYMRRCAREENNQPRAPTGAPATAPQPQGVSPAFLQSLPLVAFSSSKKKGTIMECVVCLTEFEENEPLKQLPRCKHVFHQDCIDMWLFSHTTCPLCRRTVMSDSSRSFRWGGSGSSRLSSLQRASSIAGHHPEIEGEINGPQTQGANVQGNSNLDEGADAMRPLPRSHSTGHSLLKRALSRAPNFLSRTNVPLADLQGRGDVEEEEEEEEAPGSRAGCMSVTPPLQAFQRSQSMAATPGVNRWSVGVAAWKRGLSVRKTSDADADEVALATPVGLAAASSSARSTFDRLNAV